MSLRVLVVTNMYPDVQNPDHGTFIRDQVEGLRARGHQVDVLLVGGKRRWWSYLPGTFRLWRQVLTHDYDILHAHYVFSGIVARTQFRYPLVVSFHGAAEMEGWTGTLCRLLAPLVDGVAVTSKYHKHDLGYAEAKVIPCGVDLDLFSPKPQEEARQLLGLPADQKLVLYVGLLRPEKRLDIIQRAVDILRGAGERVQLIVASGLPHEVIPLYMNACDVLALASEFEGSPVVVKEAMACNLPIVSVDVGDVRDLIANTEGCYICQRDPADMAAKLRQALAFGRRTDGRERIQYLNVEATIDGVIALYEEALAKRRRR